MGYRWKRLRRWPRECRACASIRAQLLLVLTVFLALPWLGLSRTCASWSASCATRRSARSPAPRRRSRSRCTTGRGCSTAGAELVAPRRAANRVDVAAARPRGRRQPSRRPRSADPAGTDAHDRAHLGRRPRPRRARARRPLKRAAGADAGTRLVRSSRSLAAVRVVLAQPTEDFDDDAAERKRCRARREVAAALDGIPAHRPPQHRRRRARSIVSAAHPIWVGDEVRGAVVVEETTNAVLAERNRAFERLLRRRRWSCCWSARCALTRLRDAAVVAHPPPARRRRSRDRRARAACAAPLPGSNARDEIGDLSRSFSSVLARLARLREPTASSMASRLSHELRTPIAVVRSSLDNLQRDAAAATSRACTSSAREQGLDRLDAILTRMTEAARLEQSARATPSASASTCAPWSRAASKATASRIRSARVRAAGAGRAASWTARPTSSRRCSTSWSPTPSTSRRGGAIEVAVARDGDHGAPDGRQRGAAAARGDAGAPVRVDGVGARGREAARRTWGSGSTSCA